jgi:hypothetical protein
MSTAENIVFMLIFLLLGFVFWSLLVGGGIVRAIRKDAVQHGVGEYYLDDHFENQFRWKDSK